MCYFNAMNEKFYDLSKEKQDRMLNGGMQVFAKCGYRHASTDEMVKATGVSKGLWFHYFDNKKGLYYYVCSYGIRYALLELSMQLDDSVTDYFLLRSKLEEIKMSLVDKYPYLPLLLSAIMDEDDEEAIEVIHDLKQQYIDKKTEILMQADKTIFVDGDEARHLGAMLDASFDHLLRESYRVPVFSRDNYLDGIHNYIEIAKKMVRNN